MAVDMTITTVSACRTRTGDDSFELPAGKSLKIETSPNGDELLDYTAPRSGAAVEIFVRITEPM